MKSTRKALFASLVIFTGSLMASVRVQAAVITFEGLNDLDIVTNQYAGQNAVFTNATAAVAPPAGTLNEIDFPPTSGTTVVTNEIDTDGDFLPDDLGTIEIKFASLPVDSVSGYFTYADYLFTGDPLTINAFGPLDPVNPISTLTLIENLGSPTLLSFSGIGPIASIFAFGGAGSYFTLDDLNVGNPVGGGSVVPEPSTFALMALGLVGLISRTRNKQ